MVNFNDSFVIKKGVNDNLHLEHILQETCNFFQVVKNKKSCYDPQVIEVFLKVLITFSNPIMMHIQVFEMSRLLLLAGLFRTLRLDALFFYVENREVE